MSLKINRLIINYQLLIVKLQQNSLVLELSVAIT